VNDPRLVSYLESDERREEGGSDIEIESKSMAFVIAKRQTP